MMHVLLGPGSRLAVRLTLSAIVSLVIAISPSYGQPATPTAGAAPAAAAPAAKPEYEALPYDVGQRKNQVKAMDVIRGGKFDPAGEKIFNDYFKLYALGRWTQPENLHQLAALRKETRNQLFMAKGGVSHSRLTKLLLDECSRIAVGNYHPVVRANAMLMIGDLNFDEPSKPTDDPIPLPAALPVMVAQLNAPEQIDAVRVAALVGLSRHARLGIRDAETARDVAQAALKVLTTKSVPGRSGAGNGWMRAQAAEVLGGVGGSGDLKAVAEALGQLAGDTGAPITARRAAAQAMGRLDYKSATALNREALANSLGRLAVSAYQTAKNDAQPDAAVRRMKSVLYACSQGIAGVAKGVDPAQQAFVAQVQEKVTAMMAVFDERDIRSDEVLRRMDSLAEELENGLKKAA